MNVVYKCKAFIALAGDKSVGILRELTAPLRNRISDTKSQKKLILTIVCIALLLDNMLYMVIVPIITELIDYGKEKTTTASPLYNDPNFYSKTTERKNGKGFPGIPSYPGQLSSGDDDGLIGILFASKAIVQLMANPFTGTFIDRVGYVIPLTLGLFVMFTSTILFAFAETYGLLFVARSLQGLGSALADTASLGLIADRFHNEKERSKALGIALAFISFGSLVAPPFGGFLCEYVGREWPFLILAFICFVDAMLLLLVQIPASDENRAKDGNIPVGTPIYKLFIDPYIAIIAIGLMIANFPLAFLEPTIAKWMESTMGADKFEIGLVWLPAFIPHVVGVYVTVKLTGKYFRYQWLYGAVGLVIIGVSTAAVPTCKTYGVLMLPLAFLCFGIALIDTALLPTLAFLVDVRHTSVYGSVYAIADISYSVAYSLGPILAGQTVQILGYLKMNVGIGIVNMMYAPLLLFLREVYDWKPDKSERLTLLDTETAPELPDLNKEQESKMVDTNRTARPPHQKGLSSSDDDDWGITDDRTNNEQILKNGFSQPAINPSPKNSYPYSETSIKPRPRPRLSSVNQHNVQESVKRYETTDFNEPNSKQETKPGTQNKKQNNLRKNSVTIHSSFSKQELRELAESGADLYNPLFENSVEGVFDRNN